MWDLLEPVDVTALAISMPTDDRARRVADFNLARQISAAMPARSVVGAIGWLTRWLDART
ncbi:hypothetical protein BH24ACT4_BH24ACT4_07120 [soil metagenome]